MFDILLNYLKKGRKGLTLELQTWEDTLEVLSDKQLMKRIGQVRSRIARSS